MPQQGASAAIFDLDRTLIRGASGPILQRHLQQAGLGRSDPQFVLGLLYRTFDLVGENMLTMRLTREAVRAARGWPVKQVREAAEAAVLDLVAMVRPYAKALLDEERDRGRVLVLATTSPVALVGPFAEHLGFDEVVATRWAERDGTYTGTLDGPFVWGRAKLDALRHLAADRGIDLRASDAYSDSYFDAPLLAAVGHPYCVKPDLALTGVARVRGWPIWDLERPPGVITIAGRELQELLRPFNRAGFVPNARIQIRGVEHIPKIGGAIVVANHRSYFDPTVINLVLAKAGRNARFLGKKEVFDIPVAGQVVKAWGGIRVDRGTGSNEPLQHATRALRAGEVVGIFPEGTIPRGPAFFEPELRGRWGAARLAAASGVPVIPIGFWGTEKVWPRSSRLPRMTLNDAPLVTATVGPPVELTRTDPDEDTRRIMRAIVELLPDEARVARTPTAEELALTYPPGYRGDPHKELDRRPGTDT
jgi:putative phosphoserine phosphatase/1-acylglycerol-3-phosphate O-acyltransferase